MKKLREIYIDDEYIVRDKSTSDGAQDKYYKDGYWYKADHFGGEGMAEYLSSLVLECTNLSQDRYVVYDRCLINGRPGCYSRDFCYSSNREFITFYRLYSNVFGKDLAAVTAQMDYDDAIEYVVEFINKTTDLDIREYLANTFFLDRIILNTDRHFNNMGVLFDGTKYMVAPIFDNGKSLSVGNDNKKSYSISFSASYDLNYKYLKKATDISLDVEKLQKELILIEDSPQKNILEDQLKKIF